MHRLLKTTVALGLLSSSLHAQLAITEAHSSQSTNGTVALKNDWWELTNFGSQAIDLTGFRFNDSTGGLTASVIQLDAVTIAPGESIVLLEQSATTGLPSAADFRSWWGAGLSAPVQIVTYSTNSIGLGSGGDSLFLWDAVTTNATASLAQVDFPAATPGVTFSFDPATGAFGYLSTNGFGGAFPAADGGDVGSPGTTTGPIPLAITQPPKDVTADPGTAAVFNVGFNGMPRPRFQWQRNGINLPGALGATLTVSNVSTALLGEYRVILDNGLTQVVSPAAQLRLAVQPVAPQVSVAPTNQTILLGGTASFTATASGVPQPTLTWRFNGVPIPGETNVTLTLTNVTVASAGEYVVTARNSVGTVSAPATLVIQEKPQLRITEVHNASTETTDPDFGRRLGTLLARAECACPAPEVARVQALAFAQQDWWEVTSFDAVPISLKGWRFDDNSARLASAITLTNDVTIRPGESIILVERLTPEQFRAWWGTNELPAGLQIITYSGSGIGLSSGGDALRLWDAVTTLDANTVAAVDFPAAEAGISYNYDPMTGIFGAPSQLGTNGVYQAPGSIDTELNTTYKNWGSPGRIRAGNIAPPLLTPQLTVRRDGDNLVITCTAQAQRTYRLQTSGNLTTPNWTVRGDSQKPATDGSITFTIPLDATLTFQALRVIAE